MVKMKNSSCRRQGAYGLIATLLLALLAGCSAEPNSHTTDSSSAKTDSGFVDFYDDMEMESSGMGGSLAPESIQPSEESVPSADITNLEEKLSYTAFINMESTEFDESLTAIDKLILENGAFVENSSISGDTRYDDDGELINSGNRYAFYSIRVPQANFNNFLSGANSAGLVVQNEKSVINFTTEYYDVQSRLNSYKVQEERLLSMMEQADNLADLLTIESHLTEVRYNIENLTTRINRIDSQVDYSTVNISLQEVRKYTPVEEVGYFSRVFVAIEDSLASFIYALSDFSIWLIYAFPFLLLLAIVLLIIRKILKKADVKFLEKKAKTAAEMDLAIKKLDQQKDE